VRNADWLRAHPDRNPRTWATAQGLATLPLALAGYALVWALTPESFAMPFGPRPAFYVGLMAAVGLLASWVGTLCWNEASQRLPTTLAGQLIVFETLSALAYAFMLRGTWPGPMTAAGIGLLVAGVAWALRATPQPLAADAHAS
jgi:drug/metabolite transporter (DMT)-like permease